MKTEIITDKQKATFRPKGSLTQVFPSFGERLASLSFLTYGGLQSPGSPKPKAGTSNPKENGNTIWQGK